MINNEDIPREYIRPLIELRRDDAYKSILSTLYSLLKETWKTEIEQGLMVRRLGLRDSVDKWLSFFETTEKLEAEGLIYIGRESTPWYALSEDGLEVVRLDTLLDKLMYTPLVDHILDENPELRDRIGREALKNEAGILILSDLQNDSAGGEAVGGLG